MHTQSLFYSNLFLFLSSLTARVIGQVLSNGQIFTSGLAIIDSPAPNRYVKLTLHRRTPLIQHLFPGSTLHAGSNTSIAIDVCLWT